MTPHDTDTGARRDRAPAARGRRRHDPRRRERIIDACLSVIAEHGVAGASHRRIAEAADVPLGSMTYHFSGRDELLREAFSRFIDAFAERFDARMSAAATEEEAIEAVVAIIESDVFSSRRDLVITHELYTLAAREPSYRELTTAWMGRSRASLERHFDPLTARLVDAVIEGLTIHDALAAHPDRERPAIRAVRRITRTDEEDDR